jgi:hypothetical protein
MFKYFTTRFGTEPISKLSELREAFPLCKFAGGVCKGIRGIYAFSSDTKEYGEHFELDNSDIFWNPTQANLETIKSTLSKFKTPWVDRIIVKLKCGVPLEIYPASAIPKIAMLSLRKKQPEEKNDCQYNKTNKYGNLAYYFYEKSQKDEEIRFDNDDFQNFLRLSLKESYILPIEIFDALEILSFGDFDPLFAAAMGYQYEYLQTEISKSNGP